MRQFKQALFGMLLVLNVCVLKAFGDLDLSNSAITARIVLGQLNESQPFQLSVTFPSTVGNLVLEGSKCNEKKILCTLNFPRGPKVQRTIVEFEMARLIENRPGVDLYILEKGYSGKPKAFALSVYDPKTENYTKYRYHQPLSFKGENGTGVFTFGFDLSQFGLNEGEVIRAIKISNLFGYYSPKHGDLVDEPSGQGNVIFEGSHFIGYPFLGGPLANEQMFKSKELSPELLVIAGAKKLPN